MINAPLLILSCVAAAAPDGKPYRHGAHDTGMALFSLMLEADPLRDVPLHFWVPHSSHVVGGHLFRDPHGDVFEGWRVSHWLPSQLECHSVGSTGLLSRLIALLGASRDPARSLTAARILGPRSMQDWDEYIVTSGHGIDLPPRPEIVGDWEITAVPQRPATTLTLSSNGVAEMRFHFDTGDITECWSWGATASVVLLGRAYKSEAEFDYLYSLDASALQIVGPYGETGRRRERTVKFTR